MAIYSTIAIFEYQTVVFWGSPHRCLPACIFDFQVTSSGFGTQRPSSVFAKVQRCKGVQLSLVVWVHDFFFPKEMLGPSSSSSPGSTALTRFSYTLAPSPEAYLFFSGKMGVSQKGKQFSRFFVSFASRWSTIVHCCCVIWDWLVSSLPPFYRNIETPGLRSEAPSCTRQEGRVASPFSCPAMVMANVDQHGTSYSETSL